MPILTFGAHALRMAWWVVPYPRWVVLRPLLMAGSHVEIGQG
jgi:hypothetical protein